MSNPRWHLVKNHFDETIAAVNHEESIFGKDHPIVVKERKAISYALEQNDNWKSTTANFVLDLESYTLMDSVSGTVYNLKTVSPDHAMALLEMAEIHCPESITEREYEDIVDSLFELEK